MMNCRSMGVGIFKRAGHKRHTRDTVGHSRVRPSFLGFLLVPRPTGGLRLRLVAAHHTQYGKPTHRQRRSNLRYNNVATHPALLLEPGSCHRSRCEFRWFEASSLPECSDRHSVESITKAGTHLSIVQDDACGKAFPRCLPQLS